MENMIEIKNLYKQFGDIQAVNNLSFKVKKGELFAFLGVNGAGKSTTINIICGQLKKDKGEILITGKSLDENPTFFKNIFKKVCFSNPVLSGLPVSAGFPFSFPSEMFRGHIIALHAIHPFLS